MQQYNGFVARHLKSSTTMIKNIIFDLGGVLFKIDYHLTVNAFKNAGIKNFDKIYNQLHQADFFDSFERGEISDTDFIKHIRNLSGKKITNEQLIYAWNAMLLDLPQSNLELLKKLRPNYCLFLLSNTNVIHLKALNEIIKKNNGIESLDNYFDKTYFSHQIGKRKPEKGAFLQIIEENKLDPAKTLFIDDSMQHINAAQNLGLNVYLKKTDSEWQEVIDKYNLLT